MLVLFSKCLPTRPVLPHLPKRPFKKTVSQCPPSITLIQFSNDNSITNAVIDGGSLELASINRNSFLLHSKKENTGFLRGLKRSTSTIAYAPRSDEVVSLPRSASASIDVKRAFTPLSTLKHSFASIIFQRKRRQQRFSRGGVKRPSFVEAVAMRRPSELRSKCEDMEALRAAAVERAHRQKIELECSIPFPTMEPPESAILTPAQVHLIPLLSFGLARTAFSNYGLFSVMQIRSIQLSMPATKYYARWKRIYWQV
jgi:hypothetical protein